MAHVLGLDPSSQKTGYAVLQVMENHESCSEQKGETQLYLDTLGALILPPKRKRTKKESERKGTVLKSPGDEVSYGWILTLYEGTQEILRRVHPGAVIIESIYYASHVRSVMALSEARGVLLLACAQEKIPVYGYSASHVRQAILGNGAASKEQIHTYLTNLFQLPVSVSMDATDALALALAYVYQTFPGTFRYTTNPAFRIHIVPARDGSSTSGTETKG